MGSKITRTYEYMNISEFGQLFFGMNSISFPLMIPSTNKSFMAMVFPFHYVFFAFIV